MNFRHAWCPEFSWNVFVVNVGSLLSLGPLLCGLSLFCKRVNLFANKWVLNNENSILADLILFLYWSWLDWWKRYSVPVYLFDWTAPRFMDDIVSLHYVSDFLRETAVHCLASCHIYVFFQLGYMFVHTHC